MIANNNAPYEKTPSIEAPSGANVSSDKTSSEGNILSKKTLSEEKAKLRAKIRELERGFTAEYLRESDELIISNLLTLRELENSKRIYAYASYGVEISTHKALRYFRRAGKYVYICWDWPPDVLPGKPDVIIVPGLAFDRAGYRIGKGGGYYDRLMASAPSALSIGLARDSLMLDSLPRERHDAQVSIVVTESGITRFDSAAS